MYRDFDPNTTDPIYNISIQPVPEIGLGLSYEATEDQLTITDSNNNSFKFEGYGCTLNAQTGSIATPATTAGGTVSCSGSSVPFALWAATLGAERAAILMELTAGKTVGDLQLPATAAYRTYGASGPLSPAQSIQVEAPQQAPDNHLCEQGFGALAWIACPIINFITDVVVEPISAAIFRFLSTNPLDLNPNSSQTDVESDYIHSLWKAVRNIANVLLIIGGLVLIYLQLVTADAKYFLNRTVPRIFIAAIMIQFSYFFAAFMIDITNVLAAGIDGLFTTVIEVARQDINTVATSGSLSLPNQAGQAAGVSGDAVRLTGSAIAIGIGYLTIALTVAALGPGLIALTAFSAVVGIAIAFFALVLRQLAIVVLIILGPIAMAGLILPGTTKWFREWFDNLFKLLLVYPIVVLLFSVSSLLSYAAIGTGGDGVAEGVIEQVNYFLAAALPIIALFMIPFSFRIAGRLFGGVINALQNFGGKTRGAVLGDKANPNSMRNRLKTSSAQNFQRQILGEERVPTLLRPALGVPKTALKTPLARYMRSTQKIAALRAQGRQMAQDVLSDPNTTLLKNLVFGNKRIRLGTDPSADVQAPEFYDGQFGYRPDEAIQAQTVNDQRNEVYMNAMYEGLGNKWGAHGFYIPQVMLGLQSKVNQGLITKTQANRYWDSFIRTGRGQNQALDSMKWHDSTRAGSPAREVSAWSGTFMAQDPNTGRYILDASASTRVDSLKKHIGNMHSTPNIEQQGNQSFDMLTAAAQHSGSMGAAHKSMLAELAKATEEKLARPAMTRQQIEAQLAAGGVAEDQESLYGVSRDRMASMQDFVKAAREAKLI